MDSCSLTAKQCTPCQGGIAPLTGLEAEKLLAQIPQWKLKDESTKIQRTFRFKNFMDALGFAQRVGVVCETEGHHPDICIGWGYCKIEFQTHKINGLHENDFIMAAKVNELLGEG